MQVPFIDLVREYQQIKTQVNRQIESVLKQGEYCYGRQTDIFEEKFAQLVGVPYALATASGTDSLIIALRALGIGAGDEVITTPLTFIATAEAIAFLGAKPVFVDIETSSLNIQVHAIEAAITKKTKCLLMVHLYGDCPDMNHVKILAEKYDLWIVEDASHALGSTFIGNKLGSIGDVGCFSLYPTKTLGAYGNAGILVTKEKQIYNTARQIANHGRSEDKQLHKVLGLTGTINNLQATVLNIKLKKIKTAFEKRVQIASYYNQELLGIGDLFLPEPNQKTGTVPYTYVIQTTYRDALKQCLTKKQIGTAIYYEKPLHLQPSMAYLGYTAGDFPVAERATQQILSLPCYPHLSVVEQDYVIKQISLFFKDVHLAPKAA